ncbi:hypothetical protein WBP06_00435 [Novosphingobium sp. BL-8H]|uniref:hypothetical protein n=1 Tax=Novosphingobium sp. BL-8H TaxID=3127640 RepID=UPI003756968E
MSAVFIRAVVLVLCGHKYSMQAFSFSSSLGLQAGVGFNDPDFHLAEFQVGVAECVEWLGDELVLRCHERGIRCRRFHRSDRSRVWIGFSDAATADRFRQAARRFGF